MTVPFISICIPAYKNIAFLERLLNSIAEQTFTDYEVIITDDSPDSELEKFIINYNRIAALRYFRNPSSLGTPENWNEAIRNAKAGWIKIMHHDDWFYGRYSLEKYVAAIRANSSSSFFFSAFQNVNEDTGEKEEKGIKPFQLKRLLKNPSILVAGNVMGPPSVVLYKNEPLLLYDKELKWVVDIDFYIRYLHQHKPVYIQEILVNIGVHKKQVTQEVSHDPAVVIPENFSLLNKIGVLQLNHVMVYDSWWRLLRNLKITNEEEIRQAGYNGAIHPVILSMVKWQRSIPRSILTTGIFSKCLMTIHYLLHRHLLNF